MGKRILCLSIALSLVFLVGGLVPLASSAPLTAQIHDAAIGVTPVMPLEPKATPISSLDELTWAVKASMPTARYGAITAFYNNLVYVVGGAQDTTPPFNATAVEAFDPTGNSWTIGYATNPNPRRLAGSGQVQVSSRLYIIGGITESGVVTGEVRYYNMGTNSWSTAGNPCSPRYAHGVAVLGTDIYVFGGTDGVSTLASAQKLNSLTGVWSTIESLPAADGWMAGAAANGKVYCFGGATYPSRVLEFNPSTGHWTQLANMPESRVYATAVAANNGLIYLVGGESAPSSGVARMNAVSFNPTNGAWTSEGALPASRVWPAVGASSTDLFVIGGLNRTLRPVTITNTCWQTSLPLAGVPGPVTNLQLTIFNEPQGVFLEWVNPSVDNLGNVLTDLDSVCIVRYSCTDTVNLGCLASPIIGGRETYVDDEVETAGAYQWRVTPYNTAGVGTPQSVSGFIGSEGTYTSEPLAYAWTDISVIGTLLNITSEDQVVANIPLGFNFNFYGGNYTTINVSENGWLSFASTGGYYMNACLPASGQPNDAIYPFFDDLSIAAGGHIYKYSDGSKFVVQWDNVGFYDETGVAKFQVIIWASGAIDFIYYASFTGPMNSATVGIEDATGANYLQLCCDGSGTGCPSPGVAYRVNVACPGEGSISGTVTLDPTYGGHLTNVTITTDLGDVVHPSAVGEYNLLNIMAGTRTLSASLSGYDTEVSEVVLLPYDEMTGVNFALVRRAPSQVSGFTAAWSASSESVVLFWSLLPDTTVAQYCLYRCDPGSSTFALLACVASDENGYEDPISSPEGIYQYYITAKDLGPSTPRESVPSQIERVSVGTLSAFCLTCDGYSDTRVTLDWLAPNESPVREYYYDDGTDEAGGIGFSDHGYTAARFTFEDTVTIYELRFYWTDQAEPSMHNKLYVWDTNVDGLPGTQLLEMNLNQPGGGNAFVDYEIDPPLVVESGDFFVGVYQASSLDYLGLGGDSNIDDFVYGTFVFGTTATDWTTYEAEGFFYTPMIRIYAEQSCGEPVVAAGPTGRSVSVSGMEKSTTEAGKMWLAPVASRDEFDATARGAIRRAAANEGFSAALQYPRYAAAKSAMIPGAAKTFGHLDEADFYWVYRDGARYDSIPPESTMTYDYLPENVTHTYYVTAAYFGATGTIESEPTNSVTCAANMPPGMVRSVQAFFGTYPSCSITLTWLAPTTNEDGSPCTDLAGYRIYRDGNLVAQLAPDILTYTGTLPDNDPHTYMITAVDEVPNESAPYTIPAWCEAVCNYGWVELEGDPEAVEITNVGDDDNLGFFPIGFPFEFYGQTYTLFRFASNGFITFGSTSGAYENDCPIPTTDEPNGAIYALWDDLDPTAGGTFWYMDDAVNERCIVEWSEVPFLGWPGTATFEIILYSYGGIQMQYKDVYSFETATIGIENQDGTQAVEYCCNGDGDFCPENESCICNGCIFTGTLQGTIRRFPGVQAIEGVTVEVVSTGQTAVTDATGFYQMVVPCGDQDIKIMKEGYCTRELTLGVLCNQVTTHNDTLRIPTIRVQPELIADECSAGSTCQDTFYISNPTGRCDLEFNIEIETQDGDTSWLHVDPVSGAVEPGATLPIGLTFTPQSIGHRYAWLRIYHNGADSPYRLFVGIELAAGIRQIGIPMDFALYQNFPNPFNPVTAIYFDLPSRENVRLEVFNIMGQKVATVIDGPMAAGYHAVSFDASTLPSGLYLYRMKAGDWTAMKKMMLIK
jgi:hypothetical protein